LKKIFTISAKNFFQPKALICLGMGVLSISLFLIGYNFFCTPEEEISANVINNNKTPDEYLNSNVEKDVEPAKDIPSPPVQQNPRIKMSNAPDFVETARWYAGNDKGERSYIQINYVISPENKNQFENPIKKKLAFLNVTVDDAWGCKAKIKNGELIIHNDSSAHNIGFVLSSPEKLPSLENLFME